MKKQVKSFWKANKRPERPYPALRYSEKGQQVSKGEQPSASDLQNVY